jgi:hypothetical protein
VPLVVGSGRPTVVSAGRPQPKTFTWTAPDGDVIPLCDRASGYLSLKGRAGFGMVPREVIYDASPDGGGIFRTIQDQVRIVSYPLRVQGADQTEYLERYRRLQRAFRHRRGGVDVPGTLTVGLPDGTSRSISAFYNGGLDPEETDLDDLLAVGQNHPRLEFLALDPYWTGGDISYTWASSSASVPFFGTLPLHLSASQVLGNVTADLPGDADSYPIWTLTGPGTPLLANDTTGSELVFAEEIPSGTVITIDTRPEQLTVVDDEGENWFGNLEPFPDLWVLEPGTNGLRVEMSGATEDSGVQMTAAIRWQTGW